LHDTTEVNRICHATYESTMDPQLHDGAGDIKFQKTYTRKHTNGVLQLQTT